MPLVNDNSIEIDVDANVGSLVEAEVSIDVHQNTANVSATVGASIPQYVDEHIEDMNNPHETTASQVGAYTTAEVDALLQNYYNGSAVTSDWLHIGAYYYITITQQTHNLSNPRLTSLCVLGEDGYENCIYSYTKMPNSDIRIRSSFAVDCEYRIEGEI